MDVFQHIIENEGVGEYNSVIHTEYLLTVCLV